MPWTGAPSTVPSAPLSCRTDQGDGRSRGPRPEVVQQDAPLRGALVLSVVDERAFTQVQLIRPLQPVVIARQVAAAAEQLVRFAQDCGQPDSKARLGLVQLGRPVAVLRGERRPPFRGEVSQEPPGFGALFGGSSYTGTEIRGARHGATVLPTTDTRRRLDRAVPGNAALRPRRSAAPAPWPRPPAARSRRAGPDRSARPGIRTGGRRCRPGPRRAGAAGRRACASPPP